MPKRVPFRGGHVLSTDAAVGDLFGCDVLIEDDRIAAVGHGLEAAHDDPAPPGPEPKVGRLRIGNLH